ncbi:hypothetical protein LTR37_001612 [Vermiconidia calcicola]|uniref:Uncharacterized protein n=1 Tax=Vermiconidia calcicola TaxID=1690605 RepID=A0ACC3NVK1_9PEZI|nr:hypothetical protein LTR37_001612 [Vermiconidia calcicola]
MASPSRNHQPSAAKDRLTPLPAEVRNRIYSFAVPHNGQYFHKSLSPGICRTSRKLRRETLPVWRGNNSFLYYYTKPTIPESGMPSFDPGFNIGIKHIQSLQLVMSIQEHYSTWKADIPRHGGWGFEVRVNGRSCEVAMCLVSLGGNCVKTQLNSMPSEEWKKRCLPLSALPAELRLWIYGLCLPEVAETVAEVPSPPVTRRDRTIGDEVLKIWLRKDFLPTVLNAITDVVSPPLAQTSRTIRNEVLQIWLRNNCFIFTTAQFNKLQSGRASFMHRPLEDGFQLLHHMKLTYLCVPNTSKWTKLLISTANGVFLEVKGRQYECQPIRRLTDDAPTRHYSLSMLNACATPFVFLVHMSHDEREEINQRADALVDDFERLLGRTLTMKATGAEWKCDL